MIRDKILEVKGLKKYFPVKPGVFSRVVDYVKAVDGVDIDINSGETYGLVGESGCGKTTIGYLIMRILFPSEGTVFFKGRDIFSANKTELRNLRKEIQLIFQDPYSSLNPRMTIGDAIDEPLKVHNIANKRERRERVAEILNTCGFKPYQYYCYPHEFSGGQRQRIVIARALILNPTFIVADEPVSALDVSIQSQIINFLKELQKKFGLTFLFISHDLSVVKHFSDRVGVMYLGNIVEVAEKRELFERPLHPYTQALMSAIPIMDPTSSKKRIILKGNVPNPVNIPMGCCFNTRCRHVQNICREEKPLLKKVSLTHLLACHLHTSDAK